MRYLNKEEVISHLENKNYDVVITNYLPMVGHISKKFHIDNYDYEDLVSVGTIGLIEGVKNIVPNREKHPSTYFYTSIKNELLQTLEDEKINVSVSSLNEEIFKYNNCKNSLEDLLEEYVDFDRNMMIEEHGNIVKNALCVLSEKKRFIIECRYGLNGRTPCTQNSLAKSLGMKRSTLAMTEGRALKEMRAYINAVYDVSTLW